MSAEQIFKSVLWCVLAAIPIYLLLDGRRLRRELTKCNEEHKGGLKNLREMLFDEK